MQVAVFSAKPYDRRFLERANARGDHALSFHGTRLTAATAFTFCAASSVAVAQTAPAAAPAAAAPFYTTEGSPIGDLLDNPATKAVLVKHIPAVVSNEGIERARGMTLPAIQSYSNGAITEEKLVAIDKDLAVIPEPKP